jgi:hypothetical protein
MVRDTVCSEGLRPGLRADLVALDRETLQPIATWVAGKECWGTPWAPGPFAPTDPAALPQQV